MKLAFVYDAVFPWEKGGAQKRVWELARRLANDHDVHIYGMHYWDGPKVIERNSVTLHGVCNPIDLYVDEKRSITQALKFSAAVARPLARENFDVIDCQQFPYFPIFVTKLHCHLQDAVLAVTWYEVWDDYWYDYLGKKGVFGKYIEQLAVRQPDVIVSISEHIQKQLGTIDRADNIDVIRTGVNYQELHSVEPAATEWDIVYVGRLSEHKNVHLLIDAVRILNEKFDLNVDVGIIGDGPERERLEQRAMEKGVSGSIEFLGFIDESGVMANLKAAAVYVLPSMREGLPLTVLESYAVGTPVIVVNHEENGSTSVVKHGQTGYITDMSAAAIAKKCNEVLTVEDLSATLSKNAESFAQKNDWDNIVDELEACYRSYLKQS